MKEVKHGYRRLCRQEAAFKVSTFRVLKIYQSAMVIATMTSVAVLCARETLEI